MGRERQDSARQLPAPGGLVHGWSHPGLLYAAPAAPRDGVFLLPGSGSREAVAVPAKPCFLLPAPRSLPGGSCAGMGTGQAGAVLWGLELEHPPGRAQR